MDPVARLVRLLDEAYDRPAWHGPNLRRGVRRVSVDVAVFRPRPGRKTIWEHVVHCAYWKYVVRRRLTGEKRGSFPEKGSNWFARPGPVGDWAADVKLLHECHLALRATVAAVSVADLDRVPPGCKVTVAEAVQGIALHDVYHAGQIQLLKRLAVNGGAH